MSCPACGADIPGARGICALCTPPPKAGTPGAPTMTLLNAGSSGVTSPSVAWPPAPPMSGLGPGASFSDRYTIVEEVGAKVAFTEPSEGHSTCVTVSWKAE